MALGSPRGSGGGASKITAVKKATSEEKAKLKFLREGTTLVPAVWLDAFKKNTFTGQLGPKIWKRQFQAFSE